MMSARDELAKALAVADAKASADCGGIHYETMANAIMAGGWYKPRTIRAVEELDALTEGSVVKDYNGDVFVCRTANDEAPGVFWDQVSETWPMGSDALALPVTVIHEGDAA